MVCPTRTTTSAQDTATTELRQRSAPAARGRACGRWLLVLAIGCGGRSPLDDAAPRPPAETSSSSGGAGGYAGAGGGGSSIITGGGGLLPAADVISACAIAASCASM